jgi:hypothetical protein
MTSLGWNKHLQAFKNITIMSKVKILEDNFTTFIERRTAASQNSLNYEMVP